MKTLMPRPLAVPLLALAVAATARTEVRAVELEPGSLKAEVTKIALVIKELAGKANQSNVKLAGFQHTGAMEPVANFGPRLKAELTAALKECDITVALRAGLVINVEYRTQQERVSVGVENKKRIVLELRIRIHDDLGDERYDMPATITVAVKDGQGSAQSEVKLEKKEEKKIEFTAKVTDDADVAVAVGATVELKGHEYERARQLEKSVGPDATVHVEGTRVRTSAGSPYAVEVLCGPKGTPEDGLTPLKPTLREGMPFVEIPEGHVYMLKVYSQDMEYETAVGVTVDGLSVFHFSDTDADAKHFIFGKGKEGLVRGWHKNRSQYFGFLVDCYGQDTEPKLPASESIGVISLTFAQANDHPFDLPGGRGKDEYRTGLGPPIDSPTQRVTRYTSKVQAVITIRYERPERY